MCLPINPVVRTCKRRQKRVGREFQTDHDGRGVGGLDLIDHHVKAQPRTGDLDYPLFGPLVALPRRTRGARRRMQRYSECYPSARMFKILPRITSAMEWPLRGQEYAFARLQLDGSIAPKAVIGALDRKA